MALFRGYLFGNSTILGDPSSSPFCGGHQVEGFVQLRRLLPASPTWFGAFLASGGLREEIHLAEASSVLKVICLRSRHLAD